ncbi:hypothetical protein FOMPIDRAFT_1055792 [Fomitopsis schrenkii]|uniref:Uncharacterized protein n=1 Tax=Fomitopsis schrenkii TaxID=2126942 RepID=S8EVG9_FOMSC|nr:hypothetical protein FOMPIDRAFT_1055792 [Fomitopsis schrenkii]
MPTALQLQTIHNIIDAVEREEYTGGTFQSNERKHQRAQYLTSEAHNILVTLRDEMNSVDRGAYNDLYTRLDYAERFSDASRHMQVAEEFWEFALRVFQDVSYRFITGSTRPKIRTPPQPPRPVPEPQPSPKTSPASSVRTPPPPYGWGYKLPQAYIVGWAPGWVPITKWYYG